MILRNLVSNWINQNGQMKIVRCFSKILKPARIKSFSDPIESTISQSLTESLTEQVTLLFPQILILSQESFKVDNSKLFNY